MDQMLTKRQVEILRAIVDEFIATAEPVGSKTLMSKYHLPYSSATIRNDMQALEEIGYLEKTHTSSGRIPSTNGYRFYCQYLMENKLDESMEVMLSSIFTDTTLNFEDAMDKTCNVLSRMTNLTTGSLGPEANGQRLAHIRLFPMSDTSAIVVIITDLGHTENRTFSFDSQTDMEDLCKCCDLLNDRLQGTPLSELIDRMESIKPLLVEQFGKAEMLYKAFVSAFIKFSKERVNFTGTENLMYQPEFNDIEKLKAVVSMLKDDDNVSKLTGQNSIALKTSEKNELIWVDDMAIVSSSFKINNEDAKLMVVGPSRMDYDSITSMLSYITEKMEKYFNK